MSYQNLIVEHRDAVTWVYLNRPQALNAISFACMKELLALWTELKARAETRVVVISGKGRGFCAGADLTDAPALNAEPGPEPTFLQVGTQMENALLGLGKPVIAAVNGVCCGGGLELAMMCDFIIAADTAKIGDAHANFGALPGGGATVWLPRIVGIARARYLMYTGELLPAAEAAAIGLVMKLAAPEALESDVQALAEKIASKSPSGLARMKMLLNNGFDVPTEAARATEKLVAGEHMRSWDAGEGGRAFVEKRKPQFRGY
jgi:enoyl-CoA hydratase